MSGLNLKVKGSAVLIIMISDGMEFIMNISIDYCFYGEMHMDKDNLIREYEELRNEINQKVELHNSLVTFMITTVVAILAFALESENSLLYILPFGIIIPISMRVTYYRTVMTKLSSYISVYLESDIEGLNWETRNTRLNHEEKLRSKKSNKKKAHDFFTISHYYEGMILSIMCYSLYFVDFIKDKSMSFNTTICLILPFLLVVWEYIITKRIKNFDKEKEEWKDKWQKLKNEKL